MQHFALAVIAEADPWIFQRLRFVLSAAASKRLLAQTFAAHLDKQSNRYRPLLRLLRRLLLLQDQYTY